MNLSFASRCQYKVNTNCLNLNLNSACQLHFPISILLIFNQSDFYCFNVLKIKLSIHLYYSEKIMHQLPFKIKTTLDKIYIDLIYQITFAWPRKNRDKNIEIYQKSSERCTFFEYELIFFSKLHFSYMLTVKINYSFVEIVKLQLFTPVRLSLKLQDYSVRRLLLRTKF